MGVRSTKLAVLLAVGIGAVGVASAPGVAGAACTDVSGQGVPMQSIAHRNLWLPNTTACAGRITYVSTDPLTPMPLSSASFAASDDPPDGLTLFMMRNAAGSSVEVIPVLQTAVAVLANLPAGCSASSSSSPLRAAARALQDAYDTETATFWDLFPGQLAEAVPGACRGVVTPIARSADVAPTRSFKQYLNAVDPLEWSGDTLSGTVWPSNPALSVTASGDTGMVQTVDSTDGTIGYAYLTWASSFGLSGTPDDDGFWVALPSAGGTWAEPEWVESFTLASYPNCDNTNYGAVPTTTTDADWSNVSGVSAAPVNYPICTLSYVLAYTSRYDDLPGLARTYDAGETTRRYLQYVTNSATGQLDVFGYGYGPVPSAIGTTAARGASLVNTL